MKFYTIVLNLFILSVLAAGVSQNVNAFLKISKKNEAIRIKKDSTAFIAESFRKACYSEDFSFADWQKMCKALWKLDYIGWADADSFMQIPHEDGEIVYYGTWKGDCGDGEVYCRTRLR